MFRTVFTIPRALLKLGLCATQLYPRSDTSSYIQQIGLCEKKRKTTFCFTQFQPLCWVGAATRLLNTVARLLSTIQVSMSGWFAPAGDLVAILSLESLSLSTRPILPDGPSLKVEMDWLGMWVSASSLQKCSMALLRGYDDSNSKIISRHKYKSLPDNNLIIQHKLETP